MDFRLTVGTQGAIVTIEKGDNLYLIIDRFFSDKVWELIEQLHLCVSSFDTHELTEGLRVYLCKNDKRDYITINVSNIEFPKKIMKISFKKVE